jgi:hypothetical protein
VSAYFNLFRRIRIKGKHSLDLCGPDDGLGAYIEELENILQPGYREKKQETKFQVVYSIIMQYGDHSLTNAPPSLSSIQCFGALSLFKCFFKPLACNVT